MKRLSGLFGPVKQLWICLLDKPACFFLLMFFSFFISGCTVGPKYVEPEIEAPCNWNSSHIEELDDSPVDDDPWWESFNDPLLNSLMERAASQNLDLQLALARIVEARLALKGGQAAGLPHIDGSATYSYLTYNQRTLNHLLDIDGCRKGMKQRHLNIFEAGFDAEWEIDLFGMNAHQNKMLEAMEGSSCESFRDIWVSLSAEIAKAYIELRGLQEQLAILCREIEAQKDTRELIKSLNAGGFDGELSLMQADEELGMLLSQKPQIEFLIDKNIHRLSILLGYHPGDLFCELNIPESLPELPCRRTIGIPSELLRKRPDIRKAERELAAATEQIGIAVAALFPRVVLTGFIGDIAALCGYGSLTGFAGPQLLFPIFNSKMLKQDVCMNQVKAEQSLILYQKTVLEAFEETENAIAAFHYEFQKNQSLKQVRELNRESYLLNQQLYQTGLKNYLDVQSAHRSYLSVEKVLLQSRIDLLVNYIILYKALGGQQFSKKQMTDPQNGAEEGMF